jgi:hypothetical protein
MRGGKRHLGGPRIDSKYKRERGRGDASLKRFKKVLLLFFSKVRGTKKAREWRRILAFWFVSKIPMFSAGRRFFRNETKTMPTTRKAGGRQKSGWYLLILERYAEKR